MAFTATHNAANRTRTAIAVTLIEGIAIYAVVTGLTMTGTSDPIAIFKAFNVPATPKIEPVPPPPRDKPHESVQHVTHTVMPPPSGFDMLTTNNQVIQDETGPGPIASPTPMADFQIARTRPFVSAHPKGRPGDWVTPNDYPSQDLREGNQGTVGFRLDISAQGRVTGCSITRSSGFSRIDAATCAKLSSRARFEPAVDETGTNVPGSFASTVRWTIPND